MTLGDKLADKLLMSNVKELAVLIDGEYFSHGRRLVYVSAKETADNYQLSFYVKVRNEVTGVNERQEVDNAINILAAKMFSNELYGVHVDGEAKIEFCYVDVCSSLKLLILESVLYHSVREIVEKDNNSYSFAFGTEVVPSDTLRMLKEEFIRRSYKIYGDLVYSFSVSRFVNRVVRLNKFYSLQKAFVPVFIDYQKVHCPFRSKDSIIRRTKLYNAAVHCNRYAETDSISCYYLSHLEICRALNMSEFMRFTPAFLYRVFMGLLFPGYSEFPSAAGGSRNDVLVRPNSLETWWLHQQVVTLPEAEKIIKKNQSIVDDTDSDESAKQTANGILKEIMQYERVNSLYAACIAHQSSLTNIGSPVLDNRKSATAEKLYDYVSKASISYTGEEWV